jgi:hypothetical protein
MRVAVGHETRLPGAGAARYKSTMPVFRTAPLPAGARSQSNDGRGLAVDVDADGVLVGDAPAGAQIEVQNLSVAPTGGALVGDGDSLVVADANGRFRADVIGASPGDVLQVQVRDADHSVPVAVQVRVDAARTRFDPRAAYVHPGRLVVDVDGADLVVRSRTRMPVCEPDATVRFTNTRTGAFVDVVVDPLGAIGAVRVPGQAGDAVSVAVSDGSANLDFAAVSLTLSSSKPAPALPQPQLQDRGLTLRSLRGPLISTTPQAPYQGRIGNCPVPAACGAVAAVDPNAIRDLIRAQPDGTYVVTFHPQNQPAVEIVVDDSVWQDYSGPRYGRGADVGRGAVELWFPLVEKAYAAWVGGYETLGKGTSVGKVLSELTGRPLREVWLNGADEAATWNQVKRALAQQQSMAVGTYSSSEADRYRGTGVYANHAYSVVGVEEKNGVRSLIVRNPWGSGTPVGGYGDGVFAVAWKDVFRLFQVLNIS